MGAASYMQTSFLGGEVSKHMQGRADRQDYRSWMNLCRNSLPIEEGAWTRRPGFLGAGATRSGLPGRLLEFHFNQANSYTVELTEGFLRFRRGTEMVSVDQKTVASMTDGAITTAGATGWSVGDQVVFNLVGAPTGPFGDIAYILAPKQFRITSIAGTTFNVVDTLLSNFATGRVTLGTNNIRVSKIQEFVTPYTEEQLSDIRAAQDAEDFLLFQPETKPYTIEIVTPESETSTGMAEFSFEAAVFTDGPYLDPPDDGSYLTPSGLSGTITLTETGSAAAFASTDVGRLIRLQSEPEDWAAGTYSMDEVVKFNEAYYKCVVATTVTQPDLSLDDWAVDVTAAAWTWGIVASVSSSTVITVTLAAADPAGIKAGGDLLYVLPIKTWRMGVYSDTSGYPTCGTFHEGRLWLGSNIGNRIDGSMSNRTFDFAPTSRDGTVADNNGISAVFKATDSNSPFWLLPDGRGIVVGTQGGEWLVRASDQNEPLTPTSIQAHRETDFGCEDIEAEVLPLSKVFVQRNRRKLIELAGAGYGGTHMFQGQDISLKARHFAAPGLVEITYQKEKTPIIWAVTDDGALLGCTYRRDAQISSDPVTFAGWHKHTHGCGREFVSVQAGPSVGGQTDTLNILTRDPDTGFHFVELMTDIFQEDDVITDAFFLDGAYQPSGSDIVTVDGATYIRYYGLDYEVGHTISAWIAGVDMGEFTVSATGTIDVPYGATGSLLTPTYVGTLQGNAFKYTTALYSEDGGSITYTMEAKEIYPADIASYVDANDAFENTTRFNDTVLIGGSYDHVRRKIFYWAQIYEGTDDTITNPTGHILFGGTDAFGTDWLVAADGDVDQSNTRSLYIIEKDIDTGVVTKYFSYDATKTVPVGIGPDAGSDGTWRYMVVEVSANGNFPQIIDPWTGNCWGHTQSCEAYCFRRSADFAQEILPLFPQNTEGVATMPFGFSEDWTFVRELSSTHHTLHVVPRLFTADETTAGYLLSYKDYAWPVLTNSANVYAMGVYRNGKVYVLTMAATGTSPFKLWEFTPPTLGAYPATGGGFTEVTSWTTDGPNTDTTIYTTRFSNAANAMGRQAIYQLPDDDTLALITSMVPTGSSGGNQPFRMDCTYHNVGDATFTYHQNFVGKYMTADWVVTTDVNEAAYAPLQYAAFRSVNPYLDKSSYDYGVDYQSRRIAFTCQPVTEGVVDTDEAHSVVVFTNYRFDPADAPELLSATPEAGWDDRYTDYATAISATNVIRHSLLANYDVGYNIGIDDLIYDDVTQAYWAGGRSGGTGVGGSENNVLLLDSAFAGRAAVDEIAPPLLRLTVGQSSAAIEAPAALGCTYTSDAQIVRPIAQSETGSALGPASGKTRRSHEFAALFHNVQGIYLGTDFAKLRPALFKSPGNVDYTKLQLFSGTYRDPLEDSYGYDSMICWRITRPYPATVLSLTGFIQTEN